MTKLTLGIKDTDLINSVKDYAKKNHTSLNKITENYYRSLVENSDHKISPLIRSIIPKISINKTDTELKNQHHKYLEEKYK
jgi:hypothetical protein